MTIKAIWAQSRNAQGVPVIGREGDMPWHLPEDLARFQSLTRGHAVIMGRRTWESLPERFRPLPGRINIVVTSLAALDGASSAGPYLAGSLAGALELAEALTDTGDLDEGATRWIIGGARLFADAVDVADTIEVTEIDLVVDGDTFAPDVPPDRWKVTDRTEPTASAGGLTYSYITYERRSSVSAL